jgi:hypothetical protein
MSSAGTACNDLAEVYERLREIGRRNVTTNEEAPAASLSGRVGEGLESAANEGATTAQDTRAGDRRLG